MYKLYQDWLNALGGSISVFDNECGRIRRRTYREVDADYITKQCTTYTQNSTVKAAHHQVRLTKSYSTMDAAVKKWYRLALQLAFPSCGTPETMVVLLVVG